MLKTEARLISARVTRKHSPLSSAKLRIRGEVRYLPYVTVQVTPLLSSGRALSRSALSTSTSAAVTPFRLAPGFPPLVERKTVAVASAACPARCMLRAYVRV